MCSLLATEILKITKQQWVDQHLRAWEEFVDEVKYHEVDEAHYTMLLPSTWVFSSGG
jgi:hypothetical protein